MLGQFHRGELPELSSSRGTAAAPGAEAIVKRPPTEFERVIARRRAEGLTLQSIGTEFGITADHVDIAIQAGRISNRRYRWRGDLGYRCFDIRAGLIRALHRRQRRLGLLARIEQRPVDLRDRIGPDFRQTT